jgi:hypothetical protein
LGRGAYAPSSYGWISTDGKGAVSPVARESTLNVLAAAMRLRFAVALELVAGQTWATLRPDLDCGTHCPGGTAYTECVRGTASAASRLSLHARSGRWAVSAQADSEPRPQDQRQCHPRERRRGRTRGLDSVARDIPPDNLMPRAALRWLQPSLHRARARAVRRAGPLRENPGRRLGRG